MAAELALYAAAGGRAVVDQTPCELGRDRAALARLSRATGLHVVAGCGHYVADLVSPRTAAATVDELAAELVADLSPDAAGGAPPCGLIGEIGVSSGDIAPVELRVLQAVAKAQRATGAPVSLHSMAPGHTGLEALLVLKEHGVDPGRVAVCHLDSAIDADDGDGSASGGASDRGDAHDSGDASSGRRRRLAHRPRLLPRDRPRGRVRRARRLRLARARSPWRRPGARRAVARRPRARGGRRRALRRRAAPAACWSPTTSP